MFSLLETPRNLVKAALGKVKADLIIKKTNVVNVVTTEILGNWDIVIYDGYIVRMGRINDLDKYVGNRTIIINGEKYYCIPGFIESHVHIESSMLNVREFGKLAAIHGVTSIIADPHEMGNVLGIDGIKFFIEESRYSPVRFYFEVPSCVPAVDPSLGLDSGGKIIDAGQVAMLMQDPGIIGLGEVMDFISVLNAKTEVFVKIASAKLLGKVIDGHAPMLSGEKLDAYLVAGISSDHESTRAEEALEKLRKGMYIFMREGSAWKDLEALAVLITRYSIDTRRIAIAADDISVEDLVEKGYLDYIVNKAISLGIDPIKAIQMVTINPAEHLRLDDRIGVIAPGRYADIILSPSIERISVKSTIINGKIVYKDGEWLYKEPGIYNYPEKVRKTLNIKRIPEPYELLLEAPIKHGSVVVNVIEAIPGSALTRWVKEELKVDKGYIKCDLDRDIIYIAVLDRHHGSGNIGRGFVKGLRLKKGAIAQTIAHDTHNLIVAGTNTNDMIKAVEAVVKAGGGIALAIDNEVRALIELPIAGLVSDKDYMTVYDQLKYMEEVIRDYGVNFNNIHMTLGLIALPVIPELRITDKGLVDVVNGRIIEPIVKII